MTLVERLREPHYLGDDAKARLPEPAADLIYLLRQERKEAATALTQRDEHIRVLTEALKPFARVVPFDFAADDEPVSLSFKAKDFRRARTALAISPAEADGAVNNG